jgi:hypothetical protein
MLTNVRTLIATLAVGVVLAGCSSPTSAAPSGVATLESANPAADASAEPSASLDPEAAGLAFAECMREHGIEMPDPEIQSGPGGGVGFSIGVNGKQDPERLQAAHDACSHFLEDAIGERKELDPEQLDRMVDFAECMREHGIDMPDPQTDGGMVVVGGPRDEASSDDESNGEGPQTRADVFGVDPSSPEFQAAQEACRPILGDDAFGGGPQVQTGPEQAPAKP